jgi:Zn-dependent protease
MILDIVVIIVILFSAIVLHEYAHGWMAFKLGDSTAKNAGRLTLNPLKHVDPVGTIAIPLVLLILNFMGFPLFLFGWAKPVPVNFMNLRNPKQSMIWVGMAGPIINVIIALVLSLCIKLNLFPAVASWLVLAVFINLLLAVFNMIPVPPLDGSRLVMGLLPMKHVRSYAKLEPYGILIVVVLLYLGLFQKVIVPIIFLIGKMLGVNFNEIY